MSQPYALAVHGGAGVWLEDRHAAALQGVRRAAEIARGILAAGGAALDAVVEAVAALEDDPVFNAGTGSALNLAGEAEMDACVMDGEGLRCGAVAALKRVRNPVRVARQVMEQTDHALLAGEGALRFARALGFGDHDPVTAGRLEDWRRRRAEAGADPLLPRLGEFLKHHPELASGTVGAVARDGAGRLAAASSTGGLTLKLPGRVGDTPLPGAGTYATRHAAASATGHGETILRHLATRSACDLAGGGLAAPEAVARALAALRPEGHAGMILVDARGRIGIAHGTPAMPHAWCAGEGGSGREWPREGAAMAARTRPGLG